MNRRDFGKFCATAVAAGAGVGSLGCSALAEADVKAFDKAFWNDAGADAQWYRDAYADGYRLAVLSTNIWGQNAPWPQAPAQLGRALEAGLKVAAYTRNPRWWKVGIEACGPHRGQLQFFCLDIEINPGVPVTRAMVDGVRSMGVRPVIYTSRGMWPKVMGDNTSFADVPLWDADHDRSGPVPYGGWNTPENMRVGVQHTEESRFNGTNINISDFSSGFLQ